MKFVGLLFVLLAIVLVAIADNTTDQANKYVDQIIPTIIKTKHLDPLIIGHQNIKFDTSYDCIPISINIEMQNVTVNGLSHIHRNGNAVMRNNSNIIDIQLQLNDENIIATSNVNIETTLKNFDNLNCQVDYGNIDIKFELEKNHDQFKVKQFQIDEFKQCEVTVQGSSEVESYKEYYNDEVCKQMRELIHPIIEQKIISFLKYTQYYY
uniref:Mite allergen Lep d 7-like n=1 Tax=Dermatophagoides pteronyssinus TaxID=6956 RepID=A0A6P6YDC4_DERPT|nr:mite allergen Lep d 7-like [Dermatophagoides pteronyssinus]